MKLFDGNISDIFIGRRADLGELQKIFDEIKARNEAKKVYTVLNVPGIGKTELVKHFGNALYQRKPFRYKSDESLAEEALFFHITITTIHTQSQINKKMISSLCVSFYNTFINRLDEIPDPYKKAVKEFDSNQMPTTFIQTLGRGLSFESAVKNPTNFIETISKIIPIILHFDEFQKSIPLNQKNVVPEEQLYYQLSSFFSGILDLPIFILLTGTQYTIIHTIGDNLGSPLNGKVKSIVIPFLEESDIEDYVNQIIIDTNSKEEIKIRNMYLNWLKYMSGGHPRTMEYMSEQFVNKFKPLIKSGFDGWVDEDLEEIFSDINRSTEVSLRKTHLRTKPITELKKFITENPTNMVKYFFEYVNERLMIGTNLGPLEEDLSAEIRLNNEQQIKKIELTNLLSKFVEVGFFSRNGENNFYVSSIYAFKYFSEIFHDWIPTLSETFDKLLSGYELLSFIKKNSAVMGYFWELIFSTIIEHSANLSNLIIPTDIVDVYGSLSFPAIDKKIKINQLKQKPLVNISFLTKIKPEILYTLPLAKGVDAILLYKDTVFLIQIKNSERADYVEKGLNAIIREAKRVKKSKYTIVPWLIDVLGGLKLEKLENIDILYTTKKHLAELLPERLM